MPPADIRERALEYGVRAVRLYQHLQRPRDEAANILARQYLRAATSIGANLVEAQSGESRRDFIHKCTIAQKEARESLYWLKLLLRAELVPASRLQPLLDESNELIAILTTIITRTKAKKEIES